tara:strand:+ start:804 stop:1124 length:321 start_codon:yes stop_codon:yes gene_type:complete
MDEKKNDQLFTGAKSTEDNEQTSLIKSLVNLIQHEVNIALDERLEKLDELQKKVDGIEQDAIFNDNFSDLFYEEQSNNELLTRDDLRDTVSEELDNILDELKITRQ